MQNWEVGVMLWLCGMVGLRETGESGESESKGARERGKVRERERERTIVV